ncbi:MAG: tRNA pseudouridine(55) synthase TruB [Candidatus Midichloria mitochondrii]|nr:tRNA pseudouridine(55) synthase TruB [Candidatus Midichloria mitochondrii]
MLNDRINGWFIIDKPQGMSSAAAINKLKRFVKPSKIGHTGTLDPFASGMLIAAIGEATKLVDYVMDQEKTYGFSIKWGTSTDTLDLTGSVTQASAVIPTLVEITACVEEFKHSSIIKQQPPRYSALHINGKRAYGMARAGQEFSLVEREVFLRGIKLINHVNDTTTFEVSCGKGFYVRSLARDIADKLRACGHVSYLRRIKIGKFTQFDSIKLDYLLQLVHNARQLEVLFDFLQPVNALLDDILVLRINEQEVKALRQGRRVQIKNLNYREGQRLVVYDITGGEVVAVCIFKDSELIPKRVINDYRFKLK